MKITKPKKNQILIEDDSIKDFNLEVESKTGLNNTEFNDIYEAFILGYRVPNMDASKQMFLGNKLSILTLLSSMLESLLNYELLDNDLLDDVVEAVKEARKLKGDKK